MRTARSGGAFIGCSNYPNCRYTRAFGPPGQEDASGIPPEGKNLGSDAGDTIYAFKGRFGPYVQRGEVTDDNKKPPRQSIPKGWAPEEVDLEKALRLLALPREIGPHPEDGIMIWSNIGRYGPYLKHAESISFKGGTNANLESVEEVWEIGMNRAVEVLASKPKRGKRSSSWASPEDVASEPKPKPKKRGKRLTPSSWASVYDDDADFAVASESDGGGYSDDAFDD